ncbi:hypothetical protein Nepgr_003990 [Nepenthes gracilis]|uniref:Uncharacterized protein n=1 Tax=Nepenthes gracilis TaxID=150966 RepID=A0AAD3S0R3_NEPGR|nr:hypothetical protein Nepgr_003990 [Nepenthes gracilis]
MDVECHPHTAAVMHQYPDGRGAARWMLNFGLMEVHYGDGAAGIGAGASCCLICIVACHATDRSRLGAGGVGFWSCTVLLVLGFPVCWLAVSVS